MNLKLEEAVLELITEWGTDVPLTVEDVIGFVEGSYSRDKVYRALARLVLWGHIGWHPCLINYRPVTVVYIK